jgi:hypothetical protein
MLVWISRAARRAAPAAASSSIDTAIFRRASGERSSWLALASRLWCERSSASMRRPPVEAGGHRGHLVAPVLGHALVQFAGAEGLDALLQRLQPPREPPHHRPGTGGHGQEQHQQQPPAGALGQARQRPGRPAAIGRRAQRARRHPARPAAAAPGRAHPQRAAVVQRHRHAATRLARGSPRPRSRAEVGSEAPMRRPRHRPAPSAGAGAATTRAAPGLLGGGASAGGSERCSRSAQASLLRSLHAALVAHALLLEVALHQPARHQREQRQRGHHRQPDAQVERTHDAQRLRPARPAASFGGAAKRARGPFVGVLLAREHVARAAHRQHPLAGSWGRPRSRRGCARCARRCCGRRPPAGGP